MTSLAGLYDWLVAGSAANREAARRMEGCDFRLRALPREEILLFVKPIDNSRVVRVVDRKDWMASLGMVGGVMAASLLLVGLLLPGGYSLLISKKMEDLKGEREQMVNTLRELRVKEAEMVSPDRLEQWAGQQFVNPGAGAVIFAPPTKGTVASLNRR